MTVVTQVSEVARLQTMDLTQRKTDLSAVSVAAAPSTPLAHPAIHVAGDEGAGL